MGVRGGGHSGVGVRGGRPSGVGVRGGGHGPTHSLQSSSSLVTIPEATVSNGLKNWEHGYRILANLRLSLSRLTLPGYCQELDRAGLSKGRSHPEQPDSSRHQKPRFIHISVFSIFIVLCWLDYVHLKISEMTGNLVHGSLYKVYGSCYNLQQRLKKKIKPFWALWRSWVNPIVTPQSLLPVPSRSTKLKATAPTWGVWFPGSAQLQRFGVALYL